MKRLILDHYRRWSWVLALVGAGEFALGWMIAGSQEFTFEFWAFLLSLWGGAVLVSLDLQRGMLRLTAVLPLTGKDIGRSWWVATVPIPAIGLSALLTSGAAVYCHSHANSAFPAGRLSMASLFTLVWLGIEFTLIFNATRGFGDRFREFLWTAVINCLTILMFFGSMVLCQNASGSIFKSAVILGLGALLTVVGLVRAEQFDPGRAGLYLGRIETPNVSPRAGRLTPLAAKWAPDDYRAPGGYGGMRFLLRTASVRGFLQVFAMIAIAFVIMTWQWPGHALSRPADFQMLVTMDSFMPCWFILFYLFMPMLRHTRFLRTLPISASGLALVMLALPILPLIGLGIILTSIAGVAGGSTPALAFLNSYTLSVGAAALCVFFGVWRGTGARGLFLLVLMVFLLGHLWLESQAHYLKQPLTLAGPIGAVCVLLAFVLTRQALIRSSRVYQMPTSRFGGFPIGTNS